MKQLPVKSHFVLFTISIVLQLNIIAQERAATEPSQSHNNLKIILKMDDLSVVEGKCQCIPTLEYLNKNKIKSSFGVIAERLDHTAMEVLKPFMDATNENGERLLEIWHHGLDHKRPEFQGTSYEYQKSHFETADVLVKTYLGIQMNTFGTPYNAGDSVTNVVLSENSAYNVYMFSNVVPSGPGRVIFLNQRTNMENGTGNPDFNFFLENFKRNREKFHDYMILQGHPNQFTGERMDEFKKIVEYLISDGCEFVLPYEYGMYYALKTNR